MKQSIANMSFTLTFLTGITFLILVPPVRAEMQALKAQGLPQTPICLRHNIDNETQILGYRTNGSCERQYRLGERLPTGTEMDLYIWTKARRVETAFDKTTNKVTVKSSLIEVSKPFKSKVREVVAAHVDDRGSIVIETITFDYCGSDCFYLTEITYLKFFDKWISPKINGIYVDEAVRFIDFDGRNYY